VTLGGKEVKVEGLCSEVEDEGKEYEGEKEFTGGRG
jgi:hypothetical protein